MAASDPERDPLGARLTAIAVEPLQHVGRAIEELAGELARMNDEAHERRVNASTHEEHVLAAIDEAYAQGAITALQAVSSAIFGGIAKGLAS